MSWKCNECGKITEKLLINWGICCGKKVDVLDYFCPVCPSNELTFQGTKEELDEYWDKEWES